MFRRHIKCRSVEEAQSALARFFDDVSSADIPAPQRKLLEQQVEMNLRQFIEQLTASETRKVLIERSFAGDGYSVQITASNRPMNALERLWSSISG